MSLKRVLITSGDIDGVGLEVTAKALEKLGPQRGVSFFVFRSPKASKEILGKLHKRFKALSVPSWAEALKEKQDTKQLIEIVSNLPPAKWVETATLACYTKSADALVTAPLSKPAIKEAGLSDLGHTEILKRICKSSNAYMGFVGARFNVVLATGHIPLSEVSGQLETKKLTLAIEAARQLQRYLEPKLRSQPLALLGLNPHAGDQGLIGQEDLVLLKPFVEGLRRQGIKIDGPLSPDSAFAKNNWKKYSVFVACYHDQGLIPFKTIHGFDTGVHVTLGLPIIRTSVDHGTAKDIFGKNKANPHSMIEAIRLGVQLTRSSVYV